ncbi:hypothetical protein V6C53_00355, partial [Desulfocurvibacter africanus]|uniref:hypothetical protein n=1 Tax=Desulfocurvibacter africanus TaxID=873 RepID=UPI002FDA9201
PGDHLWVLAIIQGIQGQPSFFFRCYWHADQLTTLTRIASCFSTGLLKHAEYQLAEVGQLKTGEQA